MGSRKSSRRSSAGNSTLSEYNAGSETAAHRRSRRIRHDMGNCDHRSLIYRRQDNITGAQSEIGSRHEEGPLPVTPTDAPPAPVISL